MVASFAEGGGENVLSWLESAVDLGGEIEVQLPDCVMVGIDFGDDALETLFVVYVLRLVCEWWYRKESLLGRVVLNHLSFVHAR